MKLLTPAALLCTLALFGCHYSTSYVRVTTRSAIFEQRNNGPIHAAYIEDGTIHGADAGLARQLLGNSWVDLDRCVDHPSIPQWRQNLSDLQTLAQAPDTDGPKLVQAAADFPFREPMESLLRDWSRGQPSRAALILDRIDRIDLDDAFATSLTRAALELPADATRVARWVRELIDEDHDEAVLAALTHPNAGPSASHAALLDIDDLPFEMQRAAFDAAADKIVGEAGAGSQLLEAIDELHSHQESPALLGLLERHPQPSIARAALRTIDDRRSFERREIFAAASAIACRDPGSYGTLVHAIGELPRHERCDASIALIEADDSPAEVTVLVLSACSELPSHDRARFVEAALAGPHGDDPDVRSAAEDATRSDLRRTDRQRLLEGFFAR